jgi:UDPglucose--hexose-1-phosphate uridylyltransferase
MAWHPATASLIVIEDGTPRLRFDVTTNEVRVIPNKFPTLDRSAVADVRALGPLFTEMGGHGAHEVVVESPDHDRPLSRQPAAQVDRVLEMIHSRFVTLVADSAIRAVMVFKNHGGRAGASIAHPHWQLVATPVVPLQIRHREEIARLHFEQTGRCLTCQLLDEELTSGSRILATNDDFVAHLPFASWVPYQVRISPRAHESSFGHMDRERLPELGAVLLDALGRLDRALGDPAYNLVLTTAADGDGASPAFAWQIDILPRLGVLAGFELGSGMWVNPVLPEEATDLLRSA